MSLLEFENKDEKKAQEIETNQDKIQAAYEEFLECHMQLLLLLERRKTASPVDCIAIDGMIDQLNAKKGDVINKLKRYRQAQDTLNDMLSLVDKLEDAQQDLMAQMESEALIKARTFADSTQKRTKEEQLELMDQYQAQRDAMQAEYNSLKEQLQKNPNNVAVRARMQAMIPQVQELKAKMAQMQESFNSFESEALIEARIFADSTQKRTKEEQLELMDQYQAQYDAMQAEYKSLQEQLQKNPDNVAVRARMQAMIPQVQELKAKMAQIMSALQQ